MPTLAEQIKLVAVGAIAEGYSDNKFRETVNEVLGQNDGTTNTPGAAEYLGRSESTLRLWRRKGVGPTYERDHTGRVLYSFSKLRDYRRGNVVAPVVSLA